jgi:hypothetical protein
MQPRIHNIPFYRKNRQKQGITMAMLIDIYRNNKWPMPYAERRTENPYQSSLFKELLRREDVILPSDQWRFFLKDIHVKVPGFEEPIWICSPDDLQQLNQYCPQDGEPCFVIGYLDETGTYVEYDPARGISHRVEGRGGICNRKVAPEPQPRRETSRQSSRTLPYWEREPPKQITRARSTRRSSLPAEDELVPMDTSGPRVKRGLEREIETLVKEGKRMRR